MSLLPPSTDYSGATVTQGGKKTFIAAMRTFIADLLGTDSTNTAAARTALGFDAIIGTSGAVSWRNKLENACAEVAQNSATINLTTTATYGQVDCVALWASSGSVSAGTLTQISGASFGRTGKAARIAGATLTGSAVVSWRYRMRAVDAIKLKNKTVTFQIAVRHDTGGTIDYTIIIRKPNAADDYSGVTVISTGSAQPVLTGTETTLSTVSGTGVALGDVSNGLEIEVQAACGACTTKNFDFTDWGLEEGTKVTPIDYRPYRVELQAAQRHFIIAQAEWSGSVINANNYSHILALPVAMAAAPTCTAASDVISPTSFAATATTDVDIVNSSSTFGIRINRAANATAYGRFSSKYTLSCRL